MKKSAIIAAAIASLMAGSASADNTVYGAAHASIVSVDNTTTGVKNMQVQTNTSKLGFKGSEDLGNGMKAVYQMEMSYDLTDGGGIGGARNSFVGLAGDFGTVVIGRHDTPAKSAFYAGGNDHIGDSVVDLNGTFGFREVRSNDVIAYLSPQMGDVKYAVAVVPGEGPGTAGAAGDGLTDGISLGVMYAAGGIKVGVGYEDTADLGTGADNNLINLGGSYTMDNMTFGLQYQGLTVGTTDTTIIALVGAFKMDSNTFVVAFGTQETDTAGATVDSSVMNLAINHAMSKRTSVWAGYTDSSDAVGNISESTTFALGMNHKF
jgi:predicted porin